MSLFRVRFAFDPATGWRLVSCNRSQPYASVPVQRVIHSKNRRYRYLPVLSAGKKPATPYAALCSALPLIPIAQKIASHAAARPEPEALDFVEVVPA